MSELEKCPECGIEGPLQTPRNDLGHEVGGIYCLTRQLDAANERAEKAEAAGAGLAVLCTSLHNALGRLLDGLDCNSDPEVCGLSKEEWEGAIRTARAAIAEDCNTPNPGQAILDELARLRKELSDAKSYLTCAESENGRLRDAHAALTPPPEAKRTLDIIAGELRRNKEPLTNIVDFVASWSCKQADALMAELAKTTPGTDAAGQSKDAEHEDHRH